jgi:hypothetical protein
MSERLGDIWPRIRVIGLRIGALVLLFYVMSFYTRDWRPLVPQAAQPHQGSLASRSTAVTHPASALLDHVPAPLEPATTGALSRAAQSIARRPARETVPSRSASASPPVRAQAVAPRLRGLQKPNQRTQTAARRAVRTRTAVDQASSRPQAPAEARPEEPIQFHLAERSN